MVVLQQQSKENLESNMNSTDDCSATVQVKRFEEKKLSSESEQLITSQEQLQNVNSQYEVERNLHLQPFKGSR